MTLPEHKSIQRKELEMPKNSKSETEKAADKILVELTKHNEKLAQHLTKEINSKKQLSLDNFGRKLKKLQILAAIDRPLLEKIVNQLASQQGSSGKTTLLPKSMVSFIEHMPNLKNDEISHYKEVFGGNYTKL